MTKQKLITISSICLLGLAAFFLMKLNNEEQASKISGVQAISPTLNWSQQTKLAKQIGIWGPWDQYDPALNDAIDSWHAQTGKVIFRVTGDEENLRYLVATKRARNKKSKNGLWEFPGGKVDPRETTLHATQRELQEEDPTHALHNSFLNATKFNHQNLFYKKLALRNGEKLVIFMLEISEGELEPLLRLSLVKNPLSKEIYDYRLLPIEMLNIKDKSNRNQWTAKSIKILKALRAVSSSS